MGKDPKTEENAAPAPSRFKYIGPTYKTGIRFENSGIVDPKNMSDKKIEELIKRNPSASEYFEETKGEA